MNIKVSQSPYLYKNYNNTAQNRQCNNFAVKDTFCKTNSNTNIAFKGFFDNLRSIFNVPKPAITYTEDDINATEFVKDISRGMYEVLKADDVFPGQLKCVASPQEVRELLPRLIMATQEETENKFMGTSYNIENGIYAADLDYETTYSNNGQENIYDMLDRVAAYSKIYYKNKKEDFIFAVTDRDTVESSQQVLKLISEEPEKFKHVKFIPGMKMSFAHEAPQNKKINKFGGIEPGSDYANSDMIIYGINPFSSNLINYVKETKENRKKMIVNFIDDVYKLYPEFVFRSIEFAIQNQLLFNRNYGVSDLYKRVQEYTLSKGETAIRGIELEPKDVLEDVYKIMASSFDLMVGSEDKEEINSLAINGDKQGLNRKIEEVFRKYSTHKEADSQKVVSSSENVYEDMIERLSKEKYKPVLALASPYYYVKYTEPKQNAAIKRTEFPNVVKFFNTLKEKSNGMLYAFESVSPEYEAKRTDHKNILKFNEYIAQNTNLYQVGGSFLKVQLPKN